MIRRSSLLSALGVLAAAIASVATSAPPPDWNLDERASGELVLAPETEEEIVRLDVVAEVVPASITVRVQLDPDPMTAKPGESLSGVPVALVVGEPTEVGSPDPSYLGPIPNGWPIEDGFHRGSYANVPAKEGVRRYQFRIRWESLDDGGSDRPYAERRATKIRWRAEIHSDGYDDRPAGAKVDIDPAP